MHLVFQLPETEVKDSSEGNKFELHSKALTGPSAASLPITLVAHKEEVKSRWLSEIKSFATDQVALQEHATDDLRIDPNHVQQIDVQVLKLPQRIDPTDPDSGVRPSDIAKDHFLTKSHRRTDDNSDVQAAIGEKSGTQETGVQDKTQAAPSEASGEPSRVAGAKHTVSEPSAEETPSKLLKTSDKVSRIPVKTVGKSKDEPLAASESVTTKPQVAEKKADEDTNQKLIDEEKRKAEERRKKVEDEENERRRKEDLRILEEKRKEEEDFARRQEELTKQQELRKLKEAEEERERRSQEEAERKVQLKNEENLRKIQEAGAIDIRVVETVKTEKAVVVEVTNSAVAATTNTVTSATAEETKTTAKGDQPAAAGAATEGTSDGKQPSSSSASGQRASGNAKEVPLRKIASKPIEDPDPPDRKPPHRNSDGSHPPTVIPDFNPPPALVYHTTFEVQLHKEPLPPPPVPPKITHKVVVHNESLEQRTEEFLRGHCEFNAINYSLSSAQSKIKNIKSTFGKSNQETELAEDTVRKAKSGEFQAIVHPPVPLADLLPKPKPYEVVEIVTQPGECDKLPEELQRKYDITKELLLTKKEQKMSSSKSYYSSEGNIRVTRVVLRG